MTDVMRPESHETDTAACRIVPLLFPKKWEDRVPSGRDYGVDMQLELFEEGKPTGDLLMLQIKGTTKAIDEEKRIVFDLPVQTLKYAEMFAVPFLCILCPVKTEPYRAYFVWLQDYIKVALDIDKPNWRENKKTVRISFQPENRLPDSEARLEWVAGEPRRLRDWSRLAHLKHELQHAMSAFDCNDIDAPTTIEHVRQRTPCSSRFGS